MKNGTRKKLYGATRPNWSDLHEDLLVLIARKIRNIGHIFAFRSVCVSWRSVSKTEHFNGGRQFPWRLQVIKSDGGANQGNVFAVSSERKLYETMILSSKFTSWCLGTKGWVLFLNQDGSMCLLHAFTNRRIELPSRKSLHVHDYRRRFLIHKAVLSSNPLTNTVYTLAVVYGPGHDLAVWRVGDESYTRLRLGWRGTVEDVIFHDGLLYAAMLGAIQVFDLSSPADVDVILTYQWQNGQDYLLAQGEDLVVLSRSIWFPYRGKSEICYRAFLVDLKHRTATRQIRDFGDRAIFIGGNASFWLNNASEIPGCKPNHIYITKRMEDRVTREQAFVRGEPHIASYNFADGTIN